jgi:hypothetical protein
MINTFSDKNIHEYICHYIDGTLEDDSYEVFVKYLDSSDELKNFIDNASRGSSTLKNLPQVEYPGDLMSRLRPLLN